MRIIKPLVILFTILFAGTSYANSGFYLGGAVGSTSFEDDDRTIIEFGTFMVDDDDQGAQLFFGYNFNRYIGIEATLASLGEYTDSSGTITDTYDAMTVTAVGKIPVGQGPVNFYGKAGLGVIFWEEEDTFLNFEYDDTGGTFTLGLGVMFTPGKEQYLTFRIGLDFYAFIVEERFSNREYDQAIGMGSIGLQFNF